MTQTTPITLPLRGRPLTLTPRATFRIVGIELGLADGPVSAVHALPRVASALLAGKRLPRLEVPAGLAARLWRTAVLPQALYGCELRTMPKRALQGLSAQGRSLVGGCSPLQAPGFSGNDEEIVRERLQGLGYV